MNINEPVVVIGIPTYNNRDTIRDTISAFENQTVLPDRLVFCDASTDGTADIIHEKARNVDEFNIEILSQKNKGVADAYNQILSHIESEYDIFGTVQTDFKISEDWIENAILLHRKHEHIGIINAQTGIHRELDPDEPAYFSGRCFTSKSGTLESVNGWDENFLRGEDWDIRIRFATAGIRSFGTEDLDYSRISSDPPITLKKALRKPTSAMFLKKYGMWYGMYHPSHLIADVLSVLLILGLGLIPLFPPYGLSMALVSMGIYIAGHNLIRGSIEGSSISSVLRKQLLDAIGVVSSFVRLCYEDPDWNMTGFDS